MSIIDIYTCVDPLDLGGRWVQSNYNENARLVNHHLNSIMSTAKFKTANPAEIIAAVKVCVEHSFQPCDLLNITAEKLSELSSLIVGVVISRLKTNLGFDTGTEVPPPLQTTSHAPFSYASLFPNAPAPFPSAPAPFPCAPVSFPFSNAYASQTYFSLPVRSVPPSSPKAHEPPTAAQPPPKKKPVIKAKPKLVSHSSAIKHTPESLPILLPHNDNDIALKSYDCYQPCFSGEGMVHYLPDDNVNEPPSHPEGEPRFPLDPPRLRRN